MSFKLVKSFATSSYNTGGGKLGSKKYEERALNNKNLIIEYCLRYNFTPKNILEIGYGKYPRCLELLKEKFKPNFICGIEQLDYKHNSDILCFQDFREIPKNIKFDLIYSIDVFEHVQEPELLNKLILERSNSSTLILHSIDLTSHYYPSSGINAFNHYSYKKIIWELMTSNRSSFTNRIRSYEWERIFNNKFSVLDLRNIKHPLKEEILSKFKKLDEKDTVSRVNIVMKPKK